MYYYLLQFTTVTEFHLGNLKTYNKAFKYTAQKSDVDFHVATPVNYI